MFTVSPEVNTAPAIPALLGRRISMAPSPAPIIEKSSPFFSSLRKSVERSESIIFVAWNMTFCKIFPRSISEVMSATISKSSFSFSRALFIRSTIWVVSKPTAACVVTSFTNISSSMVNGMVPSSLLRSWATPMISPLTVRIGTQRILSVMYPVFSSMLLSKRSSL